MRTKIGLIKVCEEQVKIINHLKKALCNSPLSLIREIEASKHYITGWADGAGLTSAENNDEIIDVIMEYHIHLDQMMPRIV